MSTIPTIPTIPAVTRIPTELWDIILYIAATTRDASQPRPHPTKRSIAENWRSFSLVCRHWRYVVLPYMFRVLRIHSRPPAGPALNDYPQLFACSPCQVAEVIREVVIDDPSGIYITHLDALLATLPRLQILRLHCSIRLGKVGSERVYKNYALETLQWSYESRRMFGLPRAWVVNSFLDLLALFTDIGRLEFKSDGNGETPGDQLIQGPVPEAPVFPGIRQIRSLSFERAIFVLSCLPAILLKSYDLRCITSLTVNTKIGDHMLPFINRLLELVGPTLRSVELQFSAPDDFVWSKRSANLLLDNIRGGLVACPLLEELSVAGPLRAHWMLSRTIDSWHSWPIIAATMALMDPSRMFRMRFVLDYRMREWPTIVHAIHNLPWQDIRAACKRFPNLGSLHLRVRGIAGNSNYDFVSCVKYEMREFRGTLIVEKEDSWYSRDPPKCDNSDCRRFNKDLDG